MSPEQVEAILDAVEEYAAARIERDVYLTARRTLLDVRNGREGDAAELAGKAYRAQLVAHETFNQIRAMLKEV